MSVLRGLESLAKGCSKNRSAVGPRLGKSRGCLKTYAASPLTANASRQAGDERVEGVSFRAEAVDELPVEAVVPLGH